ncbi:MAG: TonB-dependent receptor [Candidatus Pseudobacter hemicellulosilyticus]|uniref:TonB-dependent receptor n=1 Tax=Candidatus Pseudobacter hemicellulosilyticus TaxID=3121375 RepID=A0AAJ6BIV6_9BACT|nr:MAG: TonB-dependent receptor [Pseudobacter sp.]
MLLLTLAASAQQPFKHLTGKITDEQNQPVEGASIAFKSKSNASTQTNAQGMYSIPVKDSVNVILVITSIGYKPKEVWVGAAARVKNIVLESDITGLNDVVVIGYGTAKKKDLTGAVSRANVTDMKKAPVAAFSEALAGRVAGVQVSSNDGQPGEELNIVVRGNNSVTQSNAPLYVIDGFPIEDAAANLINPEEIENIEFLKDASATAIYGARGANGVVIITTKKGKTGAAVVSYDGWVGLNQVIKRMDMMSPYEFVQYQLEQNPTVGAALYLRDGKTVEDYRNVSGTNWQDALFRNALTHNHSIAIRGGSDKTRYSFSGNILDQQGTILNSGFKRYQGRLVLDQQVSNKLKAGVNINYTSTKKYGTVVSGSETSPTASLMYSIWGFRPVTGDSATDANMLDILFDPSIDPATDLRINPLLATQNTYNPVFNNTLIINSYLEYSIVKDLVLRVTGGVTKANIRREIFNNSNTRAGNKNTNDKMNGSLFNSEATNLLNENTLTWSKKINKVHNLKVMAGLSMQDSRTFTNGYSAIMVPNESLGINGLGQGQLTQAPVRDLSNGLLSYLGRVDYNFKSKYLFTVSFRADGSSKFPKDNRWAYFPSGAIAWRFTDESFMKGVPLLNDGKLRIGYGTTGNNRVGDYASLTSLEILTASGYSTGNSAGQGMVPTNLGNSQLKWETTAQTNIGLDLSFLNNRVSLTTDYYYKKTSDLLLNATLAPSMGFLTGYRNVGQVSNEGVEFTLNTRNIETKKFSWTSSFNIAFNRNKVLSLNDDEPSMATRVTWGNFNNAYPYIAIPGKPIAMFYGMLFDGVYQYSDFDQQGSSYVLKQGVPNNGNPRANIKPGDIKFRDINGDGQVDDYDLTIIGNPNPIHTGGFNNNFSYGNIDLNVFLQWSYGNDLLNANRIEFEGGDPVSRNSLNMFKSYADRWTPDNPSNSLYRVGGQGPAVYSSRTIEDGSFLRLKTVSLGYNLPAAKLKTVKIKTLRVYVAAQNLLTWTNYTGPDPEVNTRPSALTPGFDWSAYPRPRTLTVGLNMTF